MHKALSLPIFVFALVFVARTSVANAGFTANETRAMRIMYETISETLSKPGSTKLVWAEMVEGKTISDEKKRMASTAIGAIRAATDIPKYLSEMISARRGNCGEHATVLHAGLMFMKTYMSNGSPLFSSVVQVAFNPGDHVFVAVASADRSEIAILDTWADVFLIYKASSFEDFVKMPYFASVIWGKGPQTPDNPYLKPQSMMVLASNADIWPELSRSADVNFTYLNAFPGMMKFFLTL